MIALVLEAEPANYETKCTDIGAANPPAAGNDGLELGRELFDVGHKLLFAFSSALRGSRKECDYRDNG